MGCGWTLPAVVTLACAFLVWRLFEPQPRGGYWSLETSQANEILVLRCCLASLAAWSAWGVSVAMGWGGAT